MKSGKRVARKSDAGSAQGKKGGARAGKARAERKPKSKQRRIIMIAIAGFLLTGVAALAVIFWPRMPEQPSPPPIGLPSLSPAQSPYPSGVTPPPNEIAETMLMNKDIQLILGAAYFDGGTDTIMLGALNYKEHTLNVISIPRDTAILYNGKRTKINAIHAAGERAKKGSGMETLAMEIYKLLGVYSGNTVYLNSNALKRAVDAVGGVKFDVPIDMVKPYENINLRKGERTLNGEQALMLLRYRGYGSNNKAGVDHDDFGRMQMQQRFLKAAAEQMLTPKNITKIPEFVNIFNENVTTTLSTNEMTWFATQMLDIPGENIHFYTIPTESINDKGWYEYIKVGEALDILNKSVNPYTKDITGEMLRIDYAAPEPKPTE